MNRSEATSLAGAIRAATGHPVEVESENGFFVVLVRRESESGLVDEFTVRDELDWDWLRDRIREDD